MLHIFPVCKMMQVEPAAVKRMLDGELQRAYGVHMEEDVLERKNCVGDAGTQVETNELCGKEERPLEEGNKPPVFSPAVQTAVAQPRITPTAPGQHAHLPVQRKLTQLTSDVDPESTRPVQSELPSAEAVCMAQDDCDAEPPRKKIKRAALLSKVQRDVKAYIAKRKRAKRGVRIVTIRSDSAASKWKIPNGT